MTHSMPTSLTSDRGGQGDAPLGGHAEGAPQSLEWVSALVDGALDGNDTRSACNRWRDEPQVRERWHAYHLIGDVLRSDDLAGAGPARDSRLLMAVRAQLAQEPVVLAPQAAPSHSPWRRWRAQAAVAAGFVLVGGVLVVSQTATQDTLPSSLVAAGAVGAVQPVSASAALPLADRPELGAVVVDGRVIRDARLDEYLAAHKKFGGSTAPGAPSGFLRNAAVDGR